MGVAGLKSALARGEPLCEVTIQFRPGIDAVTATERINAECEDLELHPLPWYDIPQNRVGSATRGALERLFGLKLIRVRLERYDETTGTWGHWPNAWRWAQVGDPDFGRSDLGALVESASLSQPGLHDDGQPWE